MSHPSESSSNEKPEAVEPKPVPQNTMTWQDWKKLPLQFAKVYLVIFVMFVGLLSVYWGALYHREDRVKDLGMIIAIEDAEFELKNSTTAQPVMGEAFKDLFDNTPGLGRYEFANVTDLQLRATAANKTVYDELVTLVHKQKYYVAFYVNSTTSASVYSAMLAGNTLSTEAAGLDTLLVAAYESGRHFSALSQYVTKSVRRLDLAWTGTFAPLAYATMVQSYLTLDERQTLTQAANSSSTGAFFSCYPRFTLVDNRPASSPAVLGPSELGLIYAQIFSFHQFNFSADLHNTVRQTLQFKSFVVYRILFSQLNHLVLGLVYGLMTLAFQISTSEAFGKSGFLVLWMTMYLFISASGGLNECVGTIINYYDKKVFLPPWIIFTIVINIAPTFAPFELCPGFYRYGYAVPMFNAYEALKVVFFDTWKGTLGRNYGVLAGWLIASNMALCYILLFISRDTHKKAAAAKAKN